MPSPLFHKITEPALFVKIKERPRGEIQRKVLLKNDDRLAPAEILQTMQ